MKKLRLYQAMLTCMFLAVAGTSRSITAAGLIQQTDNQYFIKNLGQWPEEVLFLTRLGGLDMWITQKGLLFDFYRIEELPLDDAQSMGFIHSEPHERPLLRHGHRFWMKQVAASEPIQARGLGLRSGLLNYIGYDGFSTSGVSIYDEVLLTNWSKEVGVRFYYEGGNLRFDFIVEPGANIQKLVFDIEGADQVYKDKSGHLVLSTAIGQIQLADLFTYQQSDGKPIASRFIKKGTGWGINVGRFDRKQTLVIDPIVFSTYIGGSSSEYAYAVAVDNSGNSFITGYTLSANYDVTSGAYQKSTAGDADVFVTKLNAAGSGLIYSTYLGGSGGDYGMGIAIDGSGNAFVTGYSNSSNFPITAGAFQTSLGGNHDAFIAKLNSNGSSLLFSSYLGGTNNDFAYGIALDASGLPTITGNTFSTDFDIVSGAFQSSLGGLSDAFVTRFAATGFSLTYSTYLGGSKDEFSYGIACDPLGNAFVSGVTYSSDFDVTPGAFQTAPAGAYDAFLTKLSTTGSSLLYSTLIGGNGGDVARSVAVDEWGNGFITGQTFSSNFPVTSGVIQPTLAGSSDVFATAINASGSGLLFSTYLGGSALDVGWDIALDATGNAVITGFTFSTDFDIVAGAHQTNHAGLYDAFVSKIENSGKALSYSSYLGGSDFDYGYGMALDDLGYAWVCGATNSTNFFVTPGAYQNQTAGLFDVFLAKVIPCGISASGVSAVQLSPAGSEMQSLCLGVPLEPIIYLTSGVTGIVANGLPSGVLWNFAEDTLKLSGSPVVAGTYPFELILTDEPCKTDSVVLTGTITVFELPVVTITGDDQLCLGDSAMLIASGAVNYQWNTGDTTQSLLVSPSASVSVQVTGTDMNGCQAEAFKTIEVFPLPAVHITGDTAICKGGSAILIADGADTYVWSNGATTASVSVMPVVTTIYAVTGVDGNGCSNTADFEVVVYDVPSLTISAAPPSLCKGETVLVMASGADYYVWNNGSTDSSFVAIPDTTGTYVVVGTNSFGCSDSAAISVVVYSLPVVTATASAGIICAGESDVLTADGAVDYSWSTGETLPSILVTPLQTTVFSVTGISANGCKDSTEVMVIVNAMPDVTVSVDSVGNFVSNQPGASYIWVDCLHSYAAIPGATNQTFMPAVAGAYAVVVDLDGCVDTSVCVFFTSDKFEGNDSEQPWFVWPNPNNGVFWIYGAALLELEVFDITGRQVLRIVPDDNVYWVQSVLNTGAYLIREKSGKRVAKFVVRRQ